MKIYIKSAGYSGYSMSNNAVAAYEDGEMPLSKWTKSAILSELAELDYSQEIQDVAKKLTVAQLKDIFLFKSSWHHTSKMYNRTDFYSVNPDVSMDMINNYIETHTNQPKQAKQDPGVEYCYVSYGEWEGSKRRPKLVEYENYAIIKGPWAYVWDDGLVKKKKPSGSHFYVEKTYDEIPDDAKDIFEKIAKYM